MKFLSSFIKSVQITSQKGFTLIELLVVIGILGVLAAALVATIDPFEQLKKANDANVKNTSVEFIDANIRYYTTHSHMPWAAGGCNSGNNPTGGVTLYPALTDCLTTLVGDGEIKAAFTTVTGVLSSIIINGTSTDVTACFQPLSKSQRSDPNAKFNKDGSVHSPNTDCNPTSTACYWCSE